MFFACFIWPDSSGVEQRTENPCVGSSNLPPATSGMRKKRHEARSLRKQTESVVEKSVEK